MSAPFPSLETIENRRFLAEDPAVNLRAFDHTRYLRIDYKSRSGLHAFASQTAGKA